MLQMIGGIKNAVHCMLAKLEVRLWRKNNKSSAVVIAVTLVAIIVPVIVVIIIVIVKTIIYNESEIQTLFPEVYHREDR
jgi:chromate transport protein ChrA